MPAPPPDAEWLQADQSGGYASGTVSGPRTRRYHALLLTATHPPTGRIVLVNGAEARIATATTETTLSPQVYAPDVSAPAQAATLDSFTHTPWPQWQFRLADNTQITQDILADPATGDTILRWRSTAPAMLRLRFFISGRDYHSLHHENPEFRFASVICGNNVAWHPYENLPAIAALTNGAYTHAPLWFRNFLYTAERDRGLDHLEDLASQGEFTFPLGDQPAIVILRAGSSITGKAAQIAARTIEAETTRRNLPAARLSADAYIADRADGATILAGYPWFTDWGRDTFIAMRGLLLGTGQMQKAAQVLHAWSGLVSQGMLPNRFADDGPPEYNTCDASLWFIVASHDYLQQDSADTGLRARLQSAADAIITGHIAGTRFGIGVTGDGLLRTGEMGTQLTWMDARASGIAVTPRVGKPVEIQALWYNALRIASAWTPGWAEHAEQAAASFAAKFPDPTTGGLIDVADADHIDGKSDVAIRPNQIFAVGGLPFPLLTGAQASATVDLVQRRLLTPLGLRTLDPADPRYCPRYAGSPDQRDNAYHQGTVWPWLIGPFVEAWLRVNGSKPKTRKFARDTFLAGLEAHLSESGLGHVSEIADGDVPHHPCGCPFQAWSLGELIRARAMTK
jgi:predicted glycogen debranching enzyme